MKYIGACVVILIPLLFLHETDLTVGVRLIAGTQHRSSTEIIRALGKPTHRVVSMLQKKVAFLSEEINYTSSILRENGQWISTEQCKDEAVSDAYVDVRFELPTPSHPR
eukprot:GHVU01204714.1.p1 GENE.GHVU01204714.1~~GHVU01204714.1.p1  ORF type:complete len:109 (-),score=3.78 GHVU01204714.1:1222-1548(-)